MEETFFEFLERTRAVDHLLIWAAIITPLIIATIVALLRNSPIVADWKHRWVLAILSAPTLLLLWKIYNRITDYFGLDSVKGLLVNVAVFVMAALLATGLRLLLRSVFTPGWREA